MASIAIDFIPPDDPNIVTMHIEEAMDKEGPWTGIETVPIGEYPNYITRYTTALASSPSSWIRIRFQDDGGAFSPWSVPVQGGTRTLVGEIVDRVLLRSATVNENVAAQVAEAVIERVLNIDPYSTDTESVTYSQKEGITLLTLAYSIQAESASGESQSYVAGLVSETSKGGSVDVDGILKLAGIFLGLAPSRVAQMADIAIAGVKSSEIDQSRLMITEIT